MPSIVGEELNKKSEKFQTDDACRRRKAAIRRSTSCTVVPVRPNSAAFGRCKGAPSATRRLASERAPASKTKPVAGVYHFSPLYSKPLHILDTLASAP